MTKRQISFQIPLGWIILGSETDFYEKLMIASEY